MITNNLAGSESPSLFPFRLCAPCMVYGKGIVKNASMITEAHPNLDFLEIVLFHTPQLHNIPTAEELKALVAIGKRRDIKYTIHLPSSLEIASKNREKRAKSVRLIIDILQITQPLLPLHHILHIPISTPTLVPVPGQYFNSESSQPWPDWTSRAMESLNKIINYVGYDTKLLLENINYAPKFLIPFFKAGYAGFCLDIGHLLLGEENVIDIIKNFAVHIHEIHLHGVKGYSEHLGVDVLPKEKVALWFSCLLRLNYLGILNLEVFSPEDLKASMESIHATINNL